jgi:hypothetical protein
MRLQPLVSLVLIFALPHTVSRTAMPAMTEAHLQGHAKDAANLVACGGTMA